MRVIRKPTAAKPAVATKKTVAVKKVAATPKVTADPAVEFVDLFVSMIENKELDPYLSRIDNALETRTSAYLKEKNAEEKKGIAGKVAAPAKSKSASLAKPPVKSTESASRPPVISKPEAGKQYKINTRVKNVGGAKVEFLRFFKGNEDKAVVKILVDKPGFPKGKTFPVPMNALESTRRTTTIKK